MSLEEKNVHMANTAGTVALLAITVLGGFVISRGKKMVV